MERETVLSGYCRALDHSRMVMVAAEEGNLTEVDCDYPGCCHTQSCPIAQAIDEFLRQ